MKKRRNQHTRIKKIIIQAEDGGPALIYNLDNKGRLIYRHPVCVGLPAHIKSDTPGSYEYTPPPVKVYNKSIKKEDPSIVGTNSIKINIPNPTLNQEFTLTGQGNINSSNTIESFESKQPNLPNKENNKDINPINLINHISTSQPQPQIQQQMQSQIQQHSSTLFGFIDHSVLSLMKSYENVFSNKDNLSNAPLPKETSLQKRNEDLYSDFNFPEDGTF